MEGQPVRWHIAAMAKTPKRPRDVNQLAKMVVDIATGEDVIPPPDGRQQSQDIPKAAKAPQKP